MSAKVTNIRKSDEHLDQIDVTKYQEDLIAAEKATLVALRECSVACSSYVNFVLDTDISMTHPHAQRLHDRVSAIMNHLMDATGALSDGHKLAYRISKNVPQADIIMSGGVWKGSLESNEKLTGELS